jgi:hypothetical protein
MRELQDALRKLPAWQREIMLQVGLERVTCDDAASGLGIPVGTVRSRLARARESLRAMSDHQPSLRRVHATASNRVGSIVLVVAEVGLEPVARQPGSV